MKNILRLTKHNLEVKRLHNFRKEIYSQKKTNSDLTIASRTNRALNSTEISSALHQSPRDLKPRDLSPCLLFFSGKNDLFTAIMFTIFEFKFEHRLVVEEY